MQLHGPLGPAARSAHPPWYSKVEPLIDSPIMHASVCEQGEVVAAAQPAGAEVLRFQRDKWDKGLSVDSMRTSQPGWISPPASQPVCSLTWLGSAKSKCWQHNMVVTDSAHGSSHCSAPRDAAGVMRALSMCHDAA